MTRANEMEEARHLPDTVKDPEAGVAVLAL